MNWIAALTTLTLFATLIGWIYATATLQDWLEGHMPFALSVAITGVLGFGLPAAIIVGVTV